jgi:hypothetical protein
MGIFDRFIKKPVEVEKLVEAPKPVEVEKPKATKSTKKTAKELATEKGEPYVAIINVELDPDNIGNGAFELDWNEKFLTNLVRAGYQNKPGEEDALIVERWFQDVCRNVIQENYEQWEANQPYDARPRIIDRKDLGGGRTEVS